MSIFSELWNSQSFETRKILSGITTEHDLRNIKIIREMVVCNQKRTLAEIDKWVSNLEANLRHSESEHLNPKRYTGPSTPIKIGDE